MKGFPRRMMKMVDKLASTETNVCERQAGFLWGLGKGQRNGGMRRACSKREPRQIVVRERDDGSGRKRREKTRMRMGYEEGRDVQREDREGRTRMSRIAKIRRAKEKWSSAGWTWRIARDHHHCTHQCTLSQTSKVIYTLKISRVEIGREKRVAKDLGCRRRRRRPTWAKSLRRIREHNENKCIRVTCTHTNIYKVSRRSCSEIMIPQETSKFWTRKACEGSIDRYQPIDFNGKSKKASQTCARRNEDFWANQYACIFRIFCFYFRYQYIYKITYLVWGIPYLMPTPTRGSALITFFTVAWSGNANRIEAVDKKASSRRIGIISGPPIFVPTDV